MARISRNSSARRPLDLWQGREDTHFVALYDLPDLLQLPPLDELMTRYQFRRELEIGG